MTGPLAISMRHGGLLAAALLVATTADAASLRCGSRLVSEHMLAAEVIAACGQPDLRDVWVSARNGDAGFLGEIEEWTYNFGSSRLLRLLRFRNGRLEAIDAEGYGFAEGAAGRCGPADIHPGMSKYRLLARCGEPLTRVADMLFYPQQHGLGRHHPLAPHLRGEVVPVMREEWTYNFGANQLLRIVILENGRVSDVGTGRRGFNP
ncbi:MAG: DUF2845 domain-containing protein [Nevskiales bacterium]|nr:DUF2845 domain-containing protein [Nevskiales bacterium]